MAYRFELIAWDSNQENRIYSLAEMEPQVFDSIVHMLSLIEVPRWSYWIPRWQFKSPEEEKRNRDAVELDLQKASIAKLVIVADHIGNSRISKCSRGWVSVAPGFTNFSVAVGPSLRKVLNIMVIVLVGKTTCAICGRVIEEDQATVMFPAFLKPTHHLNRYSDSVMHSWCFDACPDKPEVERIYAKFRAIWDGRPRNLKTVEEMEAWGKAAFADFEKELYGNQ
jgi:hypothetical protein